MQELHTQSASVPETPHEVHYDEDADRQLITQSYRNLLHSFKTPLEDKDLRQLRSAYEMAVEAHKEQRIWRALTTRR